MAWELNSIDIPCTAAADLRTHQYKYVRSNGTADQVVLCNAATDAPLGILQNNPNTNQAASVRIIGVSKVVGSAALTAGWIVGTDGSGLAAHVTPGTDTTHYAAGKVLEGTGAANELATVVGSFNAQARGA